MQSMGRADDSEDVGSYEQVEYVEEVVYEEVEEDVTDDPEGSAAISTEGAANDPVPVSTVPTSQQTGSELPSSSVQNTHEQNPAPAEQHDPEWKQIEQKAQLVAHEVKEVSKKLTAGIFSAIGNVSEAGTSITKLAGDLSSWWTSLDQQQSQTTNSSTAKLETARHASAEMIAHFGLSPDESFVEDFKCKLSQVYSCSHNSFTPSIMMSFQGVMYITDRHMCFSVEERARRLPFKVAHTDIAGAARAASDKLGDRSDVLRLELRSGGHLSFKDFEHLSDLDGALALIEHLMGG